MFQRDMLDSFLTFINQLGLNLQTQPTLLTVSGGVDSVVMTDLFHRAGFQVAIVHCNFGLRGDDSTEDECFVWELARQYQLPVFVKNFDAKTYSKQQSISTQMAARDLRYGWFEEIRKENSFNWIATAHHANDALETVLLNLARGTGIAGLHGISAVKNRLIRPMLFASKEEIIAYATENQLRWREDRSNNSLDYKRNIVRKKIVPVLKELNPSIERTFLISSEKVRAADALLSGFLEQWKNVFWCESDEEKKIPIAAIKNTNEPAYSLWYLLNTYGFSFIQSEGIVKSLNSGSGKTFYSESHELLIDRDTLIFRTKKDVSSSGNVVLFGQERRYAIENGGLTISREILTTILSADKNLKAIWLDEVKVAFPLKVRKWQIGDVFYPFGMKGKRKKISDLLIDLKLNLYQKAEVNVLTDVHGEIIWVIGIRADERWRVSPENKRVLKITLDTVKEI